MHSAALSKPFLDSVSISVSYTKHTAVQVSKHPTNPCMNTHTAGFRENKKELNKKEINSGQGIKYADDWPT